MNLLEIVEIRDKLKADLAVVEKFLEIAKARGINGHSVTDATAAVVAQKINADQQPALKLNGDKEYGAIAENVRQAIRLAGDRYSIRTVSTILERIGKPLAKVQIATALARFEKRGEIEVHKRGKGSRPTIFKKKQEQLIRA